MLKFGALFVASGFITTVYVFYHLLFKRREERRLRNDEERISFSLESDTSNSSPEKDTKFQRELMLKASRLKNNKAVPYIKSNLAVSIIRFVPQSELSAFRGRSDPQIPLITTQLQQQSTDAGEESDVKAYEAEERDAGSEETEESDVESDQADEFDIEPKPEGERTATLFPESGIKSEECLKKICRCSKCKA